MTDLKLAQLVPTIQGETSLAGHSCLLVRLAGCPLTCAHCDTEWARTTDLAQDRSTREIVARAIEAGLHHVLVTGGEPLAQRRGTLKLLGELCDAGQRVQLETSGSLNTTGVDERVRTIVDIKCPSSGMHMRMDWSNLERLRDHDEVKFVVADRADFEYACNAIRREALEARVEVLLSPVHGRLDSSLLGRWLLEEKLTARLNVQLHKLAWSELD